jgi:hypothetical protein
VVKKLIVEIFVPLCGSEGKDGEIATGYPVSPKLILTARHPLFPEEPGRDKERPIEMRWRYPGAPREWQAAGEIAWESERWDLALIEYQLPPRVSPWGAWLSERRPSDDMRWISMGFPRVGGKRDGVREPFHMRGGGFSMLETEDCFCVDSDAGPSADQDWQGASGSPVIVDGRILGALVSVPSGLDGRRLKAAAIWRVLHDERDGPRFCELVGFRARDRLRDQILRQAATALRGSSEAVNALDRELVTLADPDGSDNSADPAERIAKRLLNAAVEDAIRACKSAHKALGPGSAQSAISAVIQVIVPAIYDLGTVEAYRAPRAGAAALFSLPAANATVAEIIMAGVDRRETLYCPREREDHFPKGRLSLPEPPEGGFDEDGSNAVEALAKHLGDKFCWRQADDLLRAVDDFVAKRFSGAASSGASKEHRMQAAAWEIEYQATENGRTHYLLLVPPDDEEGRAKMEIMSGELRKRYPGLAVIALDPKGLGAASQFQLLRPFIDLLPMKSKPQ